jgi:ABC-type cobalt transport system substrate-binding protein
MKRRWNVAVVVVEPVVVVLFLVVTMASIVLVLVAYPRLKEDGAWTGSDEQHLERLKDRVPGRGSSAETREDETSGNMETAGAQSDGPVDRPEPPR